MRFTMNLAFWPNSRQDPAALPLVMEALALDMGHNFNDRGWPIDVNVLAVELDGETFDDGWEGTPILGPDNSLLQTSTTTYHLEAEVYGVEAHAEDQVRRLFFQAAADIGEIFTEENAEFEMEVCELSEEEGGISRVSQLGVFSTQEPVLFSIDGMTKVL